MISAPGVALVEGLGVDYRDGPVLSAAIALVGFLVLCALFVRARRSPC